jgi:hypothetical protein
VPARCRFRSAVLVGCVAGFALAAPCAAFAELEPDAVIGAGYYPAAVNDNGQVAVNAFQGAGTAQIEVASIWNPDGTGAGTFMALNPLYSGGQSIVNGMNASGQSVGESGIDSTKTDTTPTLWSAEGDATNIAPPEQNAATESLDQGISIAPDGTPGGNIDYCPPGGNCYAPAPAMGDPLALVGPTSGNPTGSIASINSSDQGVGYEIYTLGSDVATPFADGDTGTGEDIFDNGAVVFGAFDQDGYLGIDYQSPSGVVTSIPCASDPISADGGANEYGDVAIESGDESDQYVWHSGVCYPLASVEPGLLMGWTFPSAGQPVINGFGQIATVGYPPGSSTVTAVFFTPQYPNPPAYQLTGTVKTASGQPVPGVTVQVTRASGQLVTPAVTTGSDGSYTDTLNSAPYSVSVGASGSVATGSACVSQTTSTCSVYLTANRIANFTALASAGSGSGGSGSGGSGSGGSGSGGSGSGGSGSGGSGTPSIGRAKITATTAKVPVSCSSAGRCAVKLTMSVTETISKGKVIAVGAAAGSHGKRKPAKRTVVVGMVEVIVGADKSKTVTLSLNSSGRRLLNARHALAVELTTTTGSHVVSRTTLKFTSRKRKH